MSSAGKRERTLPVEGQVASTTSVFNGPIPLSRVVLANGKQLTVSESHVMDRKDGSYRAGGPFYTSRFSPFYKDGKVGGAYYEAQKCTYNGPVRCKPPSGIEMSSVGFKNSTFKFGDKNESQMKVDGTNAISYDNPINPASNLGTTMAESIREGIPSIPGIQLWKHKTEVLKGLGSEYLNYIFGWHPLAEEVSDVRNAARFHKLIMENYHRGEGKNTHRRFDYPLQRDLASYDAGTEWPNQQAIHAGFLNFNLPTPRRTISLVRENKRWFEGCYTYALPSSTDSWRKALGYGSQADQLFGIALTPDVLWELTPWSWAVDWFSNAGEVINNVSNFGLAGLVLRYGYMMEESIERVTADVGRAAYFDKKAKPLYSTPCSSGYEIVTKRRIPASPFGFSVGWEGLSPTQLAITAALGITRLL